MELKAKKKLKKKLVSFCKHAPTPPPVPPQLGLVF